jgi:hypothetical protein
MELFIPGLIILLVSAFFVFLVVPRMGSLVLVVVSIIALIAAGVHHYSMFSSEYTQSTWQYGLASYAPWIVLGLALVFIFSSVTFFFSDSNTKSKIMNTVSTPMEFVQNAVEKAVNVMPTANTATNPLTYALNTGLRNIQAPLPVPVPVAEPVKPSPNIPGLGFPASQV